MLSGTQCCIYIYFEREGRVRGLIDCPCLTSLRVVQRKIDFSGIVTQMVKVLVLLLLPPTPSNGGGAGGHDHGMHMEVK